MPRTTRIKLPREFSTLAVAVMELKNLFAHKDGHIEFLEGQNKELREVNLWLTKEVDRQELEIRGLKLLLEEAGYDPENLPQPEGVGNFQLSTDPFPTSEAGPSYPQNEKTSTGPFSFPSSSFKYSDPSRKRKRPEFDRDGERIFDPKRRPPPLTQFMKGGKHACEETYGQYLVDHQLEQDVLHARNRMVEDENGGSAYGVDQASRGSAGDEIFQRDLEIALRRSLEDCPQNKGKDGGRADEEKVEEAPSKCEDEGEGFGDGEGEEGFSDEDGEGGSGDEEGEGFSDEEGEDASEEVDRDGEDASLPDPFEYCSGVNGGCKISEAEVSEFQLAIESSLRPASEKGESAEKEAPAPTPAQDLGESEDDKEVPVSVSSGHESREDGDAKAAVPLFRQNSPCTQDMAELLLELVGDIAGAEEGGGNVQAFNPAGPLSKREYSELELGIAMSLESFRREQGIETEQPTPRALEHASELSDQESDAPVPEPFEYHSDNEGELNLKIWSPKDTEKEDDSELYAPPSKFSGAN
ncbi:hypothetical protein HOY80DRAFT_957370 [Tuber brumale]|nr:hypothetical protein HOY80DRAFT_957370 [Tuber brumale]